LSSATEGLSDCPKARGGIIPRQAKAHAIPRMGKRETFQLEILIQIR
jgi:hypothetical protein